MQKVLPAFHFDVLVLILIALLYLFNCPNPSISHKKALAIALEYDMQWPILLFLTFQC